MDVRLTLSVCSACGGPVVYDNTGSGREPSHLESPDDHHVKFGNLDPLPAAPPPTLDDLAELLDDEDEKPTAMPPPGRPRPVDDAEWGDNRAGRRQVRNLALAQGWSIALEQWVTGPVADQWGRYSREADTIGVVFERGGLYAWAIWESMPGRAKIALSLVGATGVRFNLSVGAVKAALRAEPEPISV